MVFCYGSKLTITGRKAWEMRRLKQSDPSSMHILFHIIGVSIEMLVKNLSCQDCTYKACISVIHHKCSFWLNTIPRQFGKMKEVSAASSSFCMDLLTGHGLPGPELSTKPHLGWSRVSHWGRLGRSVGLGERIPMTACQTRHFRVICRLRHLGKFGIR